MSENEQTGSAVPGQPPRGEHATRTTTDAAAAEPAPASGMPDIPWTPPPRRGGRGRADDSGAVATDQDGEALSAHRTSGDATEGDTAEDSQPGTRSQVQLTRSARRAAGAGGAAGAVDEPSGAHPLDGLDAEPDVTRPDDGTRRRAWVLWAVIGGAVAVVVAAVVVFALLSDDDAEPAAQTVTTTIDVPTPTAEPLDRTGATALVQALPGTVRQFVLGTVEPTDTLDGALEAWTVTYSGQVLAEDGTPVESADAASDAAAPDGATSEGAAAAEADQSAAADVPAPPAFTVTVGQWEDAEQATAGAQALAAELGDPATTEEVTVGGEVTGSLSYYPSDGTTGTAVWTNGTVAIRAVGPSSELVNFATAFGL